MKKLLDQADELFKIIREDIKETTEDLLETAAHLMDDKTNAQVIQAKLVSELYSGKEPKYRA
tara:strand:- start:179 stop:364 length:186 start_codon:yes stop_codon:yes gene_type:complete